MAEKLTEEQLAAIIANQIALARNHDKNEREGSRSKALDYYLGNMDKYVPPEENRSKVVSRDVADTIGWMLPGIMRVFTASDRMAEAEPVGVEDAQFAKQATDGLNYVFWKDNKGYEIVYAATWDSLLTGNGIIKTWFDETPVYATSFHSGLTEDQVALLLQDEDTEVLAQTGSVTAIIDPAMGAATEAKVFDLKIKRKKADGRFVIEAIPPEDFLIDGDAICTDEAAFTDHWQRKTRSDLVAMGYDKDEVFSIPEASKSETPEAVARDNDWLTEATDKAMELVDYHECFVRIDVDGDGEAELIRACYAGNSNGKLLDWEVWEDEHPFDDIPCEPIPHRWDARSVADETMDVQDIKTVLTRQALNNIYAANNPQNFVEGDVKNPEELTNPTFGGTIWGKPGAKITPMVIPFVANHAFEAIAYQDEVVQRRTGVGRSSMALDPETLQNQTATANQNERDASYSQIELVARNMAEWGWRKVFRKLLRLMIKHQTTPRTIMLKGKPVDIDPRYWNADMDVTINVGLGTGSRDRDAAMLNSVLQQQVAFTDRIGVAFPDKALDMLPYIHNTLTKFAESTGLKNPEAYWPEISEDDIKAGKQRLQQQARQPDPKVQADIAKAQADQQLQVQKAQADMQLQAQKLQGEQAKADQEIQLKREQLAAELQLKREQLAAELQLKREQLAAELQMKRELGAMQAQASVESAKVSSDVHVGGNPG